MTEKEKMLAGKKSARPIAVGENCWIGGVPASVIKTIP